MVAYEHIIIGAGQAGIPLALRIAEQGGTVAIIEKGYVGGTCVNTGCTPTKAYVASARRARMIHCSEEMGIKVMGKVKVDLQKIKERKDQLVKESREGIENQLTQTDKVSLIRGSAEFIGPHHIRVNEKTYTADKIYINTGARPRIPSGYEKVNWLTNESILHLETVPEHLIIIGGGYVALEFGQMFHRFGSEVTLVVRGNRLIPQEDPYISNRMLNILEEEGLNILLGADVTEAHQEETSVRLAVDQKGENKLLKGSHLLLATGRRPNTDQIGLEKAGVKCDDDGYIIVDDALVTCLPHIRALGDCNGKGAFTHTSYNDFQIVDSHLFGQGDRFVSDRIPTYAIFTDPALARVGMNEQEILEKNIPARVAKMPMKNIARAKEMGETEGILKIFIHSKENTFLGATFLGTGADEYIHSLTDMMYSHATFHRMKNAIHIHPTISELLPTMLENLEDL